MECKIISYFSIETRVFWETGNYPWDYSSSIVTIWRPSTHNYSDMGLKMLRVSE